MTNLIGMYQNQYWSRGWPLNPWAADFQPGKREHDFSGSFSDASTCSTTESSPRAADTTPRSDSTMKRQIKFLKDALDRHVEREKDLKERLWRGCLENELAQKDGGLKTVCHCDKDSTWRRSLGGNSVDDEWTRVPDNEEPKRHAGKAALREMDVKGLEGVQRPPRLLSVSTQAPDEEIGSVASELHDPLKEEQLDPKEGMHLPEDSWSFLLEFLPVAEVVNKETRAVSRFFSNSKIWLAHLLKLMDLDSLPQRTGKKTHPAIEFSEWSHAIGDANADRVNEMEHCASEGFQGYRVFLNGLFMWNAQYPQMVQPFLTTVTQWHFSGQDVLTEIGTEFCGLMVQEFPSVRRPILVDLLSLARTKGLSPDRYEYFIILLGCCGSVYQHLGRDSVAELLVSVRSWTDESMKLRCLKEIIAILNVVLTDESQAVLANRCFKHMLEFEMQGKPDKAAAQLQKVLDLLLEKQSS